MANRSTKQSIGVRLTPDAVALLREMARRNGLSRTSVLELAIREKAAKDGVEVQGAKGGGIRPTLVELFPDIKGSICHICGKVIDVENCNFGVETEGAYHSECRQEKASEK